MRPAPPHPALLLLAAALALPALAACGSDPEPAGPSTAGPVSEIPAEPAEPVSTAPWDEARARGVDFRAVGNEPAWTMDVYSDSLVVVTTNYGADTVSAPAPAVAGSAFSFESATDAGAVLVDVAGTPCTDSMSGESFASTVTVMVGETTYRGCGRMLN